MAPDVDPGLVVRLFAREPSATAILVVGCLTGALLARPLARRLGGGAVWAGLSVASLAGIAAVTLVPDLPDAARFRVPGATSVMHGVRLCVQDSRASVMTLASGVGGPMNVILFLPAGIFLTCWFRRAVRVAAGLSGLSLLIESAQILLYRNCQAVDWVANSRGRHGRARRQTALNRWLRAGTLRTTN